MATMSAPLPKFDNTLGSLYLASSVVMALWGAGSVQTYYYYDTYRTDPWWLKAFVAVVWTLDTVHQALNLAAGYVYLVTNFGNLEYLGVVNSSILISLAFAAIVAFMVQSFFVYRIFILSNRNYVLTGITYTLSLGVFILTIYDFGKIVHFKTFLQLATDFRIVRAVNVLGVLADTAIAISLVFLLSKSRSGYKRTDSLITKLIAYSVNTSLITSISSVGSLVATIAWPQTFIFLFFYCSFTRMYTNVLLASLNSRDIPGSSANVHVHSSDDIIRSSKRSGRKGPFGDKPSETTLGDQLGNPRFATPSAFQKTVYSVGELVDNVGIEKGGELQSL